MKTINKYICEICNTEYKNADDCERCEKNHKTMLPNIKSCRYSSIGINKSGYPSSVILEFNDGEIITYKRCY